jgi:hypothetical protein
VPPKLKACSREVLDVPLPSTMRKVLCGGFITEAYLTERLYECLHLSLRLTSLGRLRSLGFLLL